MEKLEEQKWWKVPKWLPTDVCIPTMYEECGPIQDDPSASVGVEASVSNSSTLPFVNGRSTQDIILVLDIAPKTKCEILNLDSTAVILSCQLEVVVALAIISTQVHLQVDARRESDTSPWQELDSCWKEQIFLSNRSENSAMATPSDSYLILAQTVDLKQAIVGVPWDGGTTGNGVHAIRWGRLVCVKSPSMRRSEDRVPEPLFLACDSGRTARGYPGGAHMAARRRVGTIILFCQVHEIVAYQTCVGHGIKK
ncbi:hypothetical protein BKA63DRAFT_563480 [Paraphoma chrysanthemicola]|nr:hypothetical protein BKA63DRAFT_563480 [Paraphoma chrysanthemicola]